MNEPRGVPEIELKSLRDRPFELLAELERRGRAVSRAAHRAGDRGSRVGGVALRMAGDLYLVAREETREVLGVPTGTTRVPGAKPWIKGLANVRGQLLPIIDLRQFLGSGVTPVTRNTRIVVVNHREIPAGLLVDEVLGFRRFAEGGVLRRCAADGGALRALSRRRLPPRAASSGRCSSLRAVLESPRVHGGRGMSAPAAMERAPARLTLLLAVAVVAVGGSAAAIWLAQPAGGTLTGWIALGLAAGSCLLLVTALLGACASAAHDRAAACLRRDAAPARATATSRRSCGCSTSSPASPTATSRCRRPSPRTSPARSPTRSTTPSMRCAAWSRPSTARRSSWTAATRQTQALSQHLAKASERAVEADRLRHRIGRQHGGVRRGGVRQRRARRRRRAPLGRSRAQGRRCGAAHHRRHEHHPRDHPGDLQAHQAPRRELAGDRQHRRADQRHRRADQHPGAERLDPVLDGRGGRAAASRWSRTRCSAWPSAPPTPPSRSRCWCAPSRPTPTRRWCRWSAAPPMWSAARCSPRTPALRSRRSSRSPTRSRAWCRTSPAARASRPGRRRTSPATCRCSRRSAPRPPSRPTPPRRPSPSSRSCPPGCASRPPASACPAATPTVCSSSGQVRRLEDATLTTAKVRQISALGGS